MKSVKELYDECESVAANAYDDMIRYRKLASDAEHKHKEYSKLAEKYRKCYKNEVLNNIEHKCLIRNHYDSDDRCGELRLFQIISFSPMPLRRVTARGILIKYSGNDYMSGDDYVVDFFENVKSVGVGIDDIVNGYYDLIEVSDFRNRRDNIFSNMANFTIDYYEK